MAITIQTKEAAVGAELKSKVDKKDDNRLTASLAIQAFVKREHVDEIARMPAGWSGAFFDENGAPIGNLEIRFVGLELDFFGHFARGQGKHQALLEIKAGIVKKVSVRLENNGATLIGNLVWPAAGDEADEAHELFGMQCDCKATVSRRDTGTRDFVQDQNAEQAAEVAKGGQKKRSSKKKKGELPGNVTSIFKNGDAPPDEDPDDGERDEGGD